MFSMPMKCQQGVLKKDGKPTKEKGQMWIVCTGTSAFRKIALYTYRDSRSKNVAEEFLSDYTALCRHTACSHTAAESMRTLGAGRTLAVNSLTAYPKEM